MHNKRVRNKFRGLNIGMKVGLLLLACLLGSVNQGYAEVSKSPEQQAQVQSAKANPDHDLLKAAQNPVADMISLPIQSINNFGIGPHNRSEHSVSFQPVIPMALTENWMLISRIVQPVTWQPYPDRESGGVFGLGDMSPTFFLSPKHAGSVIWGVGPSLVLPTATDSLLGQGKVSIGPSAVVLAQPGNWTIGALASNVWSVAGSSGRDSVNRMSLQYFLTYNLPHDWYVSSSPIIVADWRAESGDRWLVPVGGGIGKLVMFGNHPVDIGVSFYKNVVRPDGAPEWQVNLAVGLLFPK